MSPLSLIRNAPTIVQTLVYALGILSLLTMFLTGAIDAVPKPWRDATVKRWPWTRTVALGLRTFGTHLSKFLSMLISIVRGQPIQPEDASAQTAAFLRREATARFPEQDPRRMALEFFATQIERGEHLQPLTPPAASPRGNPGMVRVKTLQRLTTGLLGLLLLGSFLVALSTVLSGCGLSPIQRQAVAISIAADTTSGGAAIIDPAARADLHRTCPTITPECAATVRTRWAPIDAAVALVATDLEAWRIAVDIARQAGTPPGPNVLRAARALINSYNALRSLLATLHVNAPALPADVTGVIAGLVAAGGAQ